MKKIGLLVVSLLLISFFSQFSSAQEAPGLGEIPFANETQQVQQQYEQYTTAQNKSDYLKQEWVKILEKNKILGPIFKVINSVFVFLSPFFKMVLGYDSLSWGFVFALIIWFALFFLIYPITAQLLNNNLIGGLATFAIVSLIGLSGAINQMVEMLNAIINNNWIFWISLAIGLILLFVFGMFGKQIKKWLQKHKKKIEEEKTERAQKMIQARGEISRQAIKPITKI